MAWAPDYASTDELAAFVRIPDTLDDTVLGLAVAAASRAVDHACGRQFGQTAAPEVRYYTAAYDFPARLWAVDVDDLMTDTGLEVDVDTEHDQTFTGVVDDYILGPRNAAAKGRPWTTLRVLPTSSAIPPALPDAVRVTARWGWSAVPDTVKQATLLQASRILSRRNSPYGIAGSPELGSETRLLAKVDPDVAVALRPYSRIRWVA